MEAAIVSPSRPSRLPRKSPKPEQTKVCALASGIAIRDLAKLLQVKEVNLLLRTLDVAGTLNLPKHMNLSTPLTFKQAKTIAEGFGWSVHKAPKKALRRGFVEPAPPGFPIAWTYGHRNEATIRGRQLALAASSLKEAAPLILPLGTVSEAAWRAALLSAGCKPKHIEREVRRVDRLARGEWVRRTVWCVRWLNGTYSPERVTRAEAFAERDFTGKVVRRRVDRLARGEWVRRTVWCVRWLNGTYSPERVTRAEAFAERDFTGKVVRRTRIGPAS